MAWWTKARGLILPQTASEARGTAVFVLIVAACVAPGVYRLVTRSVDQKKSTITASRSDKGDSLGYRSQGGSFDKSNAQNRNRENESFDPNHTNVEELRSLGLSEKQAQAYLNYLATGARFEEAEDLKRLRVLYPNQAERLMRAAEFPARIGGTTPIVREHGNYGNQSGDINDELNQSPEYEAPFLVKLKVLDLNLADSADFEALPGIGEKTAGRLVSFRESLGGFYSVGQLADVYGVDTANYNKAVRWLKVEEGVAIKPIKLNSMTEEVLKKHPYIRWRMARALIAYRDKHGAYASIEEVRKAYPPLTDAQWARLKRYIAL